MPPLVSVVIPTFNSERTIAATIQSVFEQTFRDVEIIVSDDGSQDETRAQVERFGRRVRFVQNHHQGVGATRNCGLMQAQGRYVSFLDSDDLWLPQKLETQLEAIEGRPGVSAVQCSVYLVNNRLDVVGANICTPAEDSLLDFLLFRNLAGLSTTLLADRRHLLSLGGFATDLVILEDWDLAIRLARWGGLASLSECLALYRQHPQNRSRDIGIHVTPGYRILKRLFSDVTLERDIRRHQGRIWARFFAMLAGGYVQNGEWRQGLYWMVRAILRAPESSRYLAGLPLRRFKRRRQKFDVRSFARRLPFAVNPETPFQEAAGRVQG